MDKIPLNFRIHPLRNIRILPGAESAEHRRFGLKVQLDPGRGI